MTCITSVQILHYPAEGSVTVLYKNAVQENGYLNTDQSKKEEELLSITALCCTSVFACCLGLKLSFDRSQCCLAN